MDIQLFHGCDINECTDFGVACGDLIMGNDLSTAVLISLFTDRRARADDEIPDGTTDPRGWWADALDGEQIGSRLWLLSSARAVPDTTRRAQEYCKESLQWLLDDQIVSKIDVQAAILGGCNSTLAITVALTQPDGKMLAWKYRYAWDLRQLQTCEPVLNWCS
jgi:phage gp46-like protein